MDMLLELDRNLFLFLNQLNIIEANAFWRFMSSHFAWLILIIPIISIILVKASKKFIPFLILVLLLFLCSDQFANVIKLSVERPRPCQIPDLLSQMNFIASHCGAFGFYSAHASNSLALALLSILFFKKINISVPYFSIFALLFAFLVSFSRIMVGVHYPLDIIMGWTMGAFWALSIFYLYTKIEKYWHKKAR